jgi:1-acyl-sn-glycerol-3-phosphate acyltransferase
MLLTRLQVPKLWGGSPEATWRFARSPVIVAMRMLAPTGGYGVERLPETGGAIIAANHFSGIDPTLIGIYTRRFAYFMAKLELLEVPVVGDVLRWTGVFAVRRGESDRDSIRVARWLAREGHLVGMFMEGTRQRFGYPGPVHPGAVMIALQEGVPIVPCGLDSFRWSLGNRRPCAVVFGEPISLEGLPANSRGYREGAAVVEDAIHRLWRQAAVAVAEGLPAKLPDGTRRSPPIGRSGQLRGPETRPWPEESWAKGPLGPVFAGKS